MLTPYMTRRAMLGHTVLLAMRNGNLDKAVALLKQHTGSGDVAAATLLVGRGGAATEQAFGKAATKDAVFLIASITKPMTVTSLMVLADRGEVSLSDPVERFIPEFRGDGRDRVSVKHLLTHTSGLPDMLPENDELRKRHAPLSEFVAQTCRTPLLFTPGSELRYQSMGILLAAEIVSRISKQPFPSFVREHVFQPLGMKQTSIGLGGRKISETMQCQVAEPNDWDWNSSYWRNLGSPWGGAHSTVGDISLFLEYFHHPDGRVVKPETASAMISNQTAGLSKRWGLGWMLSNGQFGKGCSARTFGHSGSTGTLCWLDPEKDVRFVLLTTKPATQSADTVLHPVSETVSTA